MQVKVRHGVPQSSELHRIATSLLALLYVELLLLTCELNPVARVKKLR
jgi:hypothetical protein